MIVLGQNNDQRGTQLEKLTKTILSGLKYKRIKTNLVAAGGSELDVTAEVHVSLPGGTDKRCMICECKATQDARTMPDWLKFLGKLHMAEVESGQEVYGCFVSLSGVNGNVAGSYESYRRAKGPKVTILEESDIIDIVGVRFGLMPIEFLLDTVRKLTQRPVKSADVAYFNDELFWVVAYERGEFSVLSAAAEPLIGRKLSEISELVIATTSHDKLIDILTEADAQRATASLEKEILAAIVSRGGSFPVSIAPSTAEAEPELLPAPLGSIAFNDLNRIMSLLSTRGWLASPTETGSLGLVTDDSGRCTHFCDIVRFMLSGDVTPAVLTGFIGTSFFDKHVDEHLLEDISRIQGNLPIPSERSKDLIALLRISPSALLRCLHPLPMIVQHRKGDTEVVDSRIDAEDFRTLMNAAYQCLSADFREPALSGYLFYVRGLRELDRRESVVVKSASGVALQGELASRLRIALGSDDFGGRFMGMHLVSDAAEPWESPEPDAVAVEEAFRRQFVPTQPPLEEQEGQDDRSPTV